MLDLERADMDKINTALNSWYDAFDQEIEKLNTFCMEVFSSIEETLELIVDELTNMRGDTVEIE